MCVHAYVFMLEKEHHLFYCETVAVMQEAGPFVGALPQTTQIYMKNRKGEVMGVDGDGMGSEYTTTGNHDKPMPEYFLHGITSIYVCCTYKYACCR